MGYVVIYLFIIFEFEMFCILLNSILLIWKFLCGLGWAALCCYRKREKKRKDELRIISHFLVFGSNVVHSLVRFSDIECSDLFFLLSFVF